MRHRVFLSVVIIVAMAFTARAQYVEVKPNPYGERPVIVPVPASVAGLDNPVIQLTGNWESQGQPAEYFTKQVEIPQSFAGRHVIIRFANLTQNVDFWVNGEYVRNYWGVNGAWTADITDFVKAGDTAQLKLRIRRSDGLGKFVRFIPRVGNDVQLYAVPEGYIERVRLHTEFDKDYKDATVRLWLRTNGAEGGSVRLCFEDARGRRLKTTPSVIALPEGMPEFQYDVKVARPLKWDAEHPGNLYKMTLSRLDKAGKVVETVERQYGFRKVELSGNQMFINGKEVKFRGVWGCNSASQMAGLNINHTRQKWPSEALLDSCDVHGIYVLDENAVDFAKFGAEIDPQYAYQWLALIEEKIERDYNHPSVVMWGLGNESFHGPNVLLTHKYCKVEDPDRPTMFSWANRVRPDEEIPYDVYSFHYSSKDADLSSYGTAVWHSESLLYQRETLPVMPVIVDEATHVCISEDELSRDPNVRNFWGESLKNFWDRSWNTKGSLGGDQFGVFRYIGADTPEVWHFRKAYSPFAISRTQYAVPSSGSGLSIEVENRFSHTNLSEVTVEWKVGEVSGSLRCPSVEPRGKGVFTVPYKNFKEGDVLELDVRRGDGLKVDEYLLQIGSRPAAIPSFCGKAPELAEDAQFIHLSGQGWTLDFDKYSGQIADVSVGGKTVIKGGPHLQLLRSGLDVGEYWPQSVKAYIDGSEAVIDMDVIYSPIKAGFRIRIDASGLMKVEYTVKHTPDPAPAAKSLLWNTADVGGYSEVGVRFTLPSSADRLEWDRKGLWTTYPENHIGRLNGVAYKNAIGTDWKDMDYDIPWNDSHWGISQRENRSGVTNDFRSSKEYFRRASVLLAGTSVGVEALSEEKDAVRLEVVPRSGDVLMYINNEWNYPTLGIGNYMKAPIAFTDGYTNTIFLRLVK